MSLDLPLRLIGAADVVVSPSSPTPTEARPVVFRNVRLVNCTKPIKIKTAPNSNPFRLAKQWCSRHYSCVKSTLCAGYRQTNKAFLSAQRLLTLGLLSATHSGMHSWFERVLKTTLTLALGASLLGGSLHAENDEPFIYATEVSGKDVVVSVHVPSDYQLSLIHI